MLFLYKDNVNDQDRDCVKYIRNELKRFECGHYFGGVNLEGSCFSVSFKSENPKYKSITTVLTEKEFNQLIEFEKAIKNLGYGIKKGDKRYKRGTKPCKKIQPVFDKLNSKENSELFEEVVKEEKEWLTDTWGLSEEDVETIFDKYSLEYRDRGIVGTVFKSVEDCGYEEAYGMGLANENNERWFDFEKFGNDLIQNGVYIELSNGRVVYLNY